MENRKNIQCLQTGLICFLVLLPLRSVFHFGLLPSLQIGSLVMVAAVYLFFAEIIKSWFYGSRQ